MSNVRALLNHFRTFSGTEAGDGGNGDATSSGGGLTPPPGGEGTIERAFGGLPSVDTGNLSFTLPAGDVGQLMVTCIGYRGDAPFTTPAGWIEIQQYSPVIGIGDGGPCGILMAYRIREAGDTGPTFTRLSGPGSYQAAGCCFGYTGVGRLTPTFLDASSLTVTTAGEPTTYGSSISPVPNCLVLATSVSGFFISLPLDDSFNAANISALTPGAALVGATDPVSPTKWGILYYNSRALTEKIWSQAFDLLWVDGGPTGQFTHNTMGGTGSNAMIVAAFAPF